MVYRGDRPNKTSFSDNDSNSVLKGNVFFTDRPEIGHRYIRNDRLRNQQGRYYLRRADDPSWMDMIDPKDFDNTHGFYRCYLSLKKPLRIDAKGESWLDIPVPKSIAAKGIISIDY